MPRRGRPSSAEAALAGDRLALARLLTAVENRTPVAEAALRRLYPHGRTGAPRRDHRAAGLGQVDARRRAHRRGPAGGRTGGGHRGRSVEPDHRRGAARRPRPDAGLRGRRRRVHPLDGVARPRRRPGVDLDGGRGRPRRRRVRPDPHRDRRDRARARSRSRPRPTRPSCSRRPRWATRSRRSRPACSRWPTSSSSTRATSPAPSGPRPSSGRCWSPRRRAATIAAVPPARPRPKRPEVLITTAATGDGVPELLGGARPAPRGRARTARPRPRGWPVPRPRSGRSSPTGSRARCATGHATATEAVLAEVAEHRLDPYAAADRLLDDARPVDADRAAARRTLARRAAIGAVRLDADDDRAGLRRGRGADGPRHRPGPRRDRAAGDALRAGPGPRRGRPRPDRRQPRSGRRQGPADRRRSRRDARPDRGHRRRSVAVADADLVIEAVFEDVAVKRGALARARRAAPRRTRSSPRTPVDRDPPPGRGRRRRPPRAVRRDALLQPGAGHAARSS